MNDKVYARINPTEFLPLFWLPVGPLVPVCYLKYHSECTSSLIHLFPSSLHHPSSLDQLDVEESIQETTLTEKNGRALLPINEARSLLPTSLAVRHD